MGTPRHFSLSHCIGHSENEKNLLLWFLTFLVLCKEVILGEGDVFSTFAKQGSQD